MKHAEAIVKAVATEFRLEFESELRKRLLDVATAEIEYIVREVSAKVHHSSELVMQSHDMTTHLYQHIKVGQ